jgi:hypothetical protein
MVFGLGVVERNHNGKRSVVYFAERRTSPCSHNMLTASRANSELCVTPIGDPELSWNSNEDT